MKQFATNNFLYVINYADPYRKNIQRHGVKAKIFTKPNYYDWRDLTLEKKFSQFESVYNDIVRKITSRTSIGNEMKHWVSQWLHMSKMRSEFVRDLAANIFTSFEKYSNGYEVGVEEMKKRNKEFVEKGQLGGKIFQFQNFQTNDYWIKLEELTKNFLTKEWVVYISEKKNFTTSDNPGFSYTHSKENQLLNIPPVFGDYNTAMDKFVVHCYPLTLKMCLCLKPFSWNDNSTEDQIRADINKQIQFENVSELMVEAINDCTRASAHKMVIGNLESDLNRYLK